MSRTIFRDNVQSHFTSAVARCFQFCCCVAALYKEPLIKGFLGAWFIRVSSPPLFPYFFSPLFHVHTHQYLLAVHGAHRRGEAEKRSSCHRGRRSRHLHRSVWTTAQSASPGRCQLPHRTASDSRKTLIALPLLQRINDLKVYLRHQPLHLATRHKKPSVGIDEDKPLCG